MRWLDVLLQQRLVGAVEGVRRLHHVEHVEHGVSTGAEKDGRQDTETEHLADYDEITDD